jgi:hypothetical protein
VDLRHVPLAGRERSGAGALARRRTVAVAPALRVGTTRSTASRFRFAAGSVRAITWSRVTPAIAADRIASVAKRGFTDDAVATPTSPFSRTRTPPAARTARRADASDAWFAYRTAYVSAIVVRFGAATTAAAVGGSLRVMRIPSLPVQAPAAPASLPGAIVRRCLRESTCSAGGLEDVDRARARDRDDRLLGLVRAQVGRDRPDQHGLRRRGGERERGGLAGCRSRSRQHERRRERGGG